MKKEVRKIYEWLQGIIEGKRPVFEDPKMQEVWENYMNAMDEYRAGVDSEEITFENFQKRYEEIIGPKRKAYENYQTLKAMRVKITPVEKKG